MCRKIFSNAGPYQISWKFVLELSRAYKQNDGWSSFECLVWVVWRILNLQQTPIISDKICNYINIILQLFWTLSTISGIFGMCDVSGIIILKFLR